MVSVSEHYNDHLGRIYTWMIGDVAAALRRNRAELEGLGVRPGLTRVAIDLGAGPGLHAIPLAEVGFSVIAVDSCPSLIGELRERAARLPIRVVESDLLRFRDHCADAVDVILCMGDTLTHLASAAALERLLDEVAGALAPAGVFIATFRDYVSTELAGDARFIPVRSDATRILTCFLEYARDKVTVHDILHEHGDAGWQQSVSSYPKLRVDPDAVVSRLERAALAVERDVGAGGMVRIVARRQAMRSGA